MSPEQRLVELRCELDDIRAALGKAAAETAYGVEKGLQGDMS